MSNNVKILSSEQQNAIDYLYANDASLLIAGTGVGKTIITLTTIDELIKDKVINRCLVLCPAKVVSNWTKEVNAWGLNVSITGGTGFNFINTLKTTDIVVTSYESALKLLEKDSNFDALVLDEVTKLKMSGGVTARGLMRYRKYFKWVVGLSATPLAESWEHAYGIMKILDGGETFGRNQEKFKREYFNQMDFKGYKWELKPEKANELTQKLARKSYIIDESIKREKVNEPVYLDNYIISIPDPIVDMQIELIRHNYISINNCDVSAVNAAVLTGKLRQLAQGFIIDDDENVHYIDDFRINAFINIIKEKLKLGGLVATYEFNAIGDKLKTLYPHADIISGATKKAEFERIMQKWRSGKGTLLFIQVKAGSHGLDGLQYSSSQILHFAPIWSRDATLQLEGRLDRTGQEKRVEIQTMVASDSIDETILQRVEIKASFFKNFLTFIDKNH